jgi:hypothetical protein
VARAWNQRRGRATRLETHDARDSNGEVGDFSAVEIDDTSLMTHTASCARMPADAFIAFNLRDFIFEIG